MADNIILVMSDSHGQYIPQFFADDCRELWQGVKTEDYETLLNGPDFDTNPHYWETWDSVLNAAFIIVDNKRYSLHQDGDLWAIAYDDLSLNEYADFFGDCRECGRFSCRGECMNENGDES